MMANEAPKLSEMGTINQDTIPLDEALEIIDRVNRNTYDSYESILQDLGRKFIDSFEDLVQLKKIQRTPIPGSALSVIEIGERAEESNKGRLIYLIIKTFNDPGCNFEDSYYIQIGISGSKNPLSIKIINGEDDVSIVTNSDGSEPNEGNVQAVLSTALLEIEKSK